MQIPKSKDTLMAIWLLTILMWLPPAWHYFFKTDFFLKNTRGLQNLAVSAPILLIILAYAVLLTLPKTRTWNMICSAGGSFVTMGLLMEYYDVFSHMGGMVVMLFGGSLLNTCRFEKMEKTYETAADKAMAIDDAAEPGTDKTQKSRI